MAASPPAAYITQLWRRQHSRELRHWRPTGSRQPYVTLPAEPPPPSRQCDFGDCAVAANITSAEGRIGGSAVAAKLVFGGHRRAPARNMSSRSCCDPPGVGLGVLFSNIFENIEGPAHFRIREYSREYRCPGWLFLKNVLAFFSPLTLGDLE